jgi:hypothetical protein
MKHTVQKLVALPLIIFLSGACCLFCSVIPVVSAAHCPLERSGHCGKKSGQLSSAPSFTREGLDGVLRCPFISKRSETAQKPVIETGAAAVKTAGISFLSSFSAAKNSLSPHSYRSVVRNRGSTYLANCVFRI